MSRVKCDCCEGFGYHDLEQGDCGGDWDSIDQVWECVECEGDGMVDG